MNTPESLAEYLDKLPEKINVNVVFGEPRTIGDRTVIPVAEVRYAFGLTQGTNVTTGCCTEDEDSPKRSGGLGAKARPIAYIEINKDGTRVEPIIDDQKVALAGILLVGWAAGWLGVVLKALLRPRA